MELEREPRKKPRTSETSRLIRPLPKQTTQTPPQKQTAVEITAEKKLYVREVCAVLGVLLLTIGLVGFVVDDLLGAHLSYVHNLIHVSSGVLAITYAYVGLTAAKRFAIIFGAVYLLLGVFGFIFGVPGVPSHGNLNHDPYLWNFAPEVLELGSVDHGIHLILGGGFLLSAFLKFKKRKKTAVA